MTTLLRLSAPHFLALADLVLDRSGTKDALGTSLEDDRCAIRRSVDGTTLLVRMKAVGRDVHETLVGAREAGATALAGPHWMLASHLEDIASRTVPGERVVSFLLVDGNGVEATHHVVAKSLADARRTLVDGTGRTEIRDLVGVATPEDFAAGMPEGTATVETPDVALDRAQAARVAEAETIDHEVYSIVWREDTAGGSPAIFTMPPTLATGLADAEACFRMAHAKPGSRIAQIVITPLAEYLRSIGPRGRAPAQSPGVRLAAEARSGR